MSGRFICLRGGAEHNLQDLDLDLPQGRLIAITGVSGSGKTSLAFDTLYAEARRRFLLTTNPNAAQRLRAPRFRLLDGLAPALAIAQDRAPMNPRSTVAVLAGIYDYLRLLFSRLGEAHCLRCGAPVRAERFEEVYETGAALPAGTALTVLALRRVPVDQPAAQFLAAIDRTGYRRLRLEGRICTLDEVDPAALPAGTWAEIAVDRLVVKPETLRRLQGSLQAALEVGEGQLILAWEGGERRFSVLPSCSACATPFRPLSAALFSFNSAQGACPACRGLGRGQQLDQDQVLDQHQASLAEALGPLWTGELRTQLLVFCHRHHLDPEGPLAAWEPGQRGLLWEGAGKRAKGLRHWLANPGLQERAPDWFAGRLAHIPCPACQGRRLVPEALAVEVGGHTIAALTAGAVREVAGVVAAFRFAPTQAPVADALVGQILRRLSTLEELGLAYLTLDRRADTLSSGEFQRLRLSAALGAGLTQVLYVLDEPSTGLHARDAGRLLEFLRKLRDAGTTVLVVEHDPLLIRGSDYLVDLGPGAGIHGGRLLAQGAPDAVLATDSPTARFLKGQDHLPVGPRRPPGPEGWLHLDGAAGHNLQDLTVRFPLGNLVCVTGVSGSGKTSLVLRTLCPLLARHLGPSGPPPLAHRACTGLDLVERLVEVDQRPLGRSPRSNAATYTGLMGELRLLFAELPTARLRGYRASHFSFNAPEGACPECRGSGLAQDGDWDELARPCLACGGSRYRGEVLDPRYRDLNIAQTLGLSVAEARERFAAIPGLARRLELLDQVGLGYLRLGQPAPSLSGGEAQRVKLAAELARPSRRHTLYVLDEPTTGLHRADVSDRLELLQRLVDQGNTALVIEHHLELIAAADYVIDLGPEGGEAGGELDACGPPQELSAVERTWTGRCLKEYLAGRP
ncbi:MAG: excinuclease ABC subunit UvrA [Candidatus Latescibacteria bacterium]|nr:excinuclease ABC subunit UvrA [Candidatus Latescibacterota bacterium]